MRVVLEYNDGSKKVASFINNKYYVYLTCFELNMINVNKIHNL